MHELSLAQSLLEQVQAVARRHQAKGVAKVVLQIGPLAGVEPRLLQEAFPIASAGSVADGAVLVIESLPIRVRCRRCGAESEATTNRLMCGACGDWQTQLLSGDELLLAGLELIT